MVCHQTIGSPASRPPAVDTIKAASAVDREHLLNLFSSWEEQSAHSEINDPRSLERSKAMFFTLRARLDDPSPSPSPMPRYSDEEAQLLQKATTTKTSRTWNDGTHLRTVKITYKIASKYEREFHKCAKEEARKRAKRWPQKCHGRGCGSQKCDSCYGGFEE